MKKIFVIAIFLLVLPLSVFASPFGLEMGMSLDEIKEVCKGVKPEHIEDDRYLIYPEKKHPLFEQYIAYVDDSIGLYYIKAISTDIKTNDYGTELQNAFHDIKDRISKTYGEPIVIDEVRSDSYFKEDKYWLQTLRDGARTLSALWFLEKTKEISDNLAVVGIFSNVYKYDVGYIVLEYQFTNYATIKEKQDEVF